jgi:hypothetical protein
VTQNSPIGGEGPAAQHIVQLFDSTESLVETVSAFVRDGLIQGDAVLVVMRLPQWNSIASRLSSRNVALSDAIGSGQLTVLDVARTLARIMWYGTPIRGLFDEVVGQTVRQIRSRGAQLRVYGDMVDALAEDGNFHAAHELEKLCSDLVAQEPMTLLCGYSAATFYSPEASETFRSICRSHTDVRLNQIRVPPVAPAVLDRRP